MSERVIFIVGLIVFAMTVYGTVMAAGLALSRAHIEQNPEVKAEVKEKGQEKRFPFRSKY